MKSITKTTLVFLFIICLVGSFPLPASSAEEPWLTGWNYRKEISITSASGAGTNYQVFLNVTYDSDMQVGFDDLRVTDGDKITELDYWLEYQVNSSYVDMWVEVADDLGSNQLIYLYYGNGAVSTTSSGADTFNFFEDWTSETIGAQWTVENADGSVSFDDTDSNHGTVIKVEGAEGTDIQSFYSDDAFSKDYALRMRSYSEKTVASSQSTKQGWNDVGANAYAMLESYQGAARIVIRDDDANTDHKDIADSNYDSWHVFDSYRWEVGNENATKWFTDGVEVASGSCDPDLLDWHVYVYVRDSEYDTYNDWFVIRKYVVGGEPTGSVGDEEDNKDWKLINSISFFFNVPIHEWGMNTALIILGLVMIPISGLYLAYGIKHDRSSDRLFYGLIIFILGCGLFIGGILP